MEDYRENNQVTIAGVVEEAPVFNHEVYSEKFYIFTLRVLRLSEISDHIKVMISERLFGSEFDIQCGDHIQVSGQFRSYNNYSGSGNRLVLTVFTKDIQRADEAALENPNQIFLDGFVCKEPVYRVTPFGREIADILIAVNRSYNKSDYIPAIAWGRNARFCRDIKVGTHIRLWGRIQSREYQKKLSEQEIVTKVAYEVSIGKMELEQQNLDNRILQEQN